MIEKTIAEIEELGFKWPYNSDVEEFAVMSEQKVDLEATLQALRDAQESWAKQYAEARRSIRDGQWPGARSADEITDSDVYAGRCREGADHIERIIAAFTNPS